MWPFYLAQELPLCYAVTMQGVIGIAGKTDYKNKWISDNKERINLVVDKGKKDAIKSHADKQDESVNGFINRAIDETIERDNVPDGTKI